MKVSSYTINQSPITVYQQDSRLEISFFQLELSAYSHLSLGAPHLRDDPWYLLPLEQFICLIYLLLLMITGFIKWEKISKYPTNEKSFRFLFRVSSKNCSFVLLLLFKDLPRLFPLTDQFSLWWIHHILKAISIQTWLNLWNLTQQISSPEYTVNLDIMVCLSTLLNICLKMFCCCK